MGCVFAATAACDLPRALVPGTNVGQGRARAGVRRAIKESAHEALEPDDDGTEVTEHRRRKKHHHPNGRHPALEQVSVAAGLRAPAPPSPLSTDSHRPGKANTERPYGAPLR